MAEPKPAYRDRYPCPGCSTGYLDCAQLWVMSLKCCADCSHPGHAEADPAFTDAEVDDMRHRAGLVPCSRCGGPLRLDGNCDACKRDFYEKIELLERHYARLATESTNARAEEILANIDTAPAVELKDGEVVLLGFEGEVDAVIPLREPRPIVFLRPIPLTLREMLAPPPDELPTKPEPMRVAEYRRIGESTYQRET